MSGSTPKMVPGKPLSGLKVLDLAQGVAGPHCSMLLGQAGASVTKVEPIGGEWGRTIGKMYGDLAAHAIAYNRGKRSLALDLKMPQGRDIVMQLAKEADIIVESFRPGVVARMGLDYTSLSTNRPDLLYLSVSGFGQQGLYRDRPVTDSVIQAFSGWMTANTTRSGEPQRNNMVVIDMITGLYAFNALLLAYLERIGTGQGRYIDCSLMQVAAAFQTPKIITHHLEGNAPAALYVPAGTVKTADGYLNFAAMHESRYRALCRVIGRPDLAEHPDFDTRDKRVSNAERLMPQIEAAFAHRTTAEWGELLGKEEIQNSAVNGYGDYLNDPHVIASGSYAWVDQADVGRLPIPFIPGMHTDTNSKDVHCPHAGENSAEILAELGYDNDRINAMHAAGVIGLYMGRAI